jgi:hypothetical protein
MVAILKHVGTANWDRETLNLSLNTPASCSEGVARNAVWAGSLARVYMLKLLHDAFIFFYIFVQFKGTQTAKIFAEPTLYWTNVVIHITNCPPVDF